MDNIKNVFDFWECFAKSKRPKSKSYENVKTHINGSLTLAKLKFFSFAASLLEPYLIKYDGDGPMLPFVNEDVKKLFKNLLALIIKLDVIAKCKLHWTS